MIHFYLKLMLYILPSILAQNLPKITADQIPVEQQLYDFSAASRCRLLGHESIIVNNEQHHLLIVDGGFGLFKTSYVNGTVAVADLNPYTVAFDLSSDFDTLSDLLPAWSHKKSVGSTERFTILNHGGLWASYDGNTIWSQGGHYYHADRWSKSAYFVPKADIPEWQLWRMQVNATNRAWQDITDEVDGHTPNRTFAGAAVSIPKNGRKYWLGGLYDSTTSPSTPNGTLETVKHMLVFDEDSQNITKRTYYDSSDNNGYWQGSLIHLPVGNGSGYLVSLMAVKRPVEDPWPDVDGETGNFENGTVVDLEYVQIYDIDRNTWSRQRTTFFGWTDAPRARTRFCADIFINSIGHTYDIWMHGGQRLDDQNQGVEEIYVLSMPSFTWTKVTTAGQRNYNLIRSHTCHAVGGQLLVIGGYPPAQSVTDLDVECDSDYVKVLKIEDKESVWTKSYVADTVYHTPKDVRDATGTRTSPIGGFANSRLENDFELSRSPPASPSPSASSATRLMSSKAWAWWYFPVVFVLLTPSTSVVFFLACVEITQICLADKETPR